MDRNLSIHHHIEAQPDISRPDPHQDMYSMTVLGFWIYLLTDCLLFGTLFTTYVVMKGETFGGPTSKDLFSLTLAFTETMVLLFSSVSCGLAVLASLKDKKNHVIGWLAVTFILGLAFIGMELKEFTDFVQEGHSWQKSAFLSSFFTLVGTHGLHVSFGLIWMGAMMAQIYHFGVNTFTFRRLAIFSMFWHFLDLIWIFIFTLVYLMGVI